jgi:hypothetical protein
MAPAYDHINGGNVQNSPFDWECLKCFKTASAWGPPVFNSKNCSCAEAGAYANGVDHSPKATADESPDSAYRSPESYASSSASVKCPEGPELEEQNLHIGTSYLPLVPDQGLNEAQHRRSASFNSDMSYHMRRFLVEQNPNELSQVGHPVSSETRFLRQDVHLQYQQIKKKKRSSKLSDQSMLSSDSGFLYL